MPAGYNEYCHGLYIGQDIQPNENTPEYIHKIVAIDHIKKSDHLVALNHGKELLANGVNSICTTPLQINNNYIGHMVMFCDRVHHWNSRGKNYITRKSQRISSILLEAKEYFIRLASTK